MEAEGKEGRIVEADRPIFFVRSSVLVLLLQFVALKMGYLDMNTQIIILVSWCRGFGFGLK